MTAAVATPTILRVLRFFLIRPPGSSSHRKSASPAGLQSAGQLTRSQPSFLFSMTSIDWLVGDVGRSLIVGKTEPLGGPELAAPFLWGDTTPPRGAACCHGILRGDVGGERRDRAELLPGVGSQRPTWTRRA